MHAVTTGIRPALPEYGLTFKHRGDLSLRLQLNGNQRVRFDTDTTPSLALQDNRESASARRSLNRTGD